MNRVAKQWEDFNRLVLIPARASGLQTEEMRKAFYAGAQSLLAVMTSSFDTSAEPTDNDLKIMDEIALELKLFFSSMQTAKAGQA